LLYPQEIIAPIFVTVVKFTVLAMYWRLFPTRFMKWSSIIVGVLTLGWCFGVMFPTIFQCEPIKKKWNPMMDDGHCHEAIIDWISHQDNIPAIILDIFLFLLPVWEVKRLHASISTKVAIGIVFLLASLSIIARIMLFAVASSKTKADFMDITCESTQFT
jgi:hypothetical protein